MPPDSTEPSPPERPEHPERPERWPPDTPGPVGRARVCPSGALAEGQVLAADIGGVRIAVTRRDGRLLAFSALCPHRGFDLSAGWLEDGGVRCPHHLWHFELDGGACTNVPGFRLPLHDAADEDGFVVVELRR